MPAMGGGDLKKVLLALLLVSAIAYRPLTTALAAYLLLTGDWVLWLLGLAYGDSLAPGVRVVRGLGGSLSIVRGLDGKYMVFYRVSPLLDISSQGAKALRALSAMLGRLDLRGVELAFARLGDVRVVRIAYTRREDLDRLLPILQQYFVIEELPAGEAARIIGRVEPVPRAWLAVPVIAGLTLGMPLTQYWPFGLALALCMGYAMWRALPRLSIVRSPARFGSSLAGSDLPFMAMGIEDYLPIAMGNAQAQYWALVITEDPG